MTETRCTVVDNEFFDDRVELAMMSVEAAVLNSMRHNFTVAVSQLGITDADESKILGFT
jgi:hypothetical protein